MRRGRASCAGRARLMAEECYNAFEQINGNEWMDGWMNGRLLLTSVVAKEFNLKLAELGSMRAAILVWPSWFAFAGCLGFCCLALGLKV